MDKELIISLNKSFESSAYEANGVEYWLARDLQVLLEYTQWRNFELVIEKAKVSCQTAGQDPIHHFAGVSKMVALGTYLHNNLNYIIIQIIIDNKLNLRIKY